MINTHKSLSLLYKSVPPAEVPFACLEINLRTKWTGRWQGDKAVCTVCLCWISERRRKMFIYYDKFLARLY